MSNLLASRLFLEMLRKTPKVLEMAAKVSICGFDFIARLRKIRCG